MHSLVTFMMKIWLWHLDSTQFLRREDERRGEGWGGVGWGWCGWVGWGVGGLPDGGEHEAKGRRILESLIGENWRTCRRDGGRVFLPGEGKWCFLLQYRGTQFSPQIREIWETVSIFPLQSKHRCMKTSTWGKNKLSLSHFPFFLPIQS